MSYCLTKRQGTNITSLLSDYFCQAEKLILLIVNMFIHKLFRFLNFVYLC